MTLLTFLLQAGIISLSGVMAPGPLTAVTMGKGMKSPHAGALIARSVGFGTTGFVLFAVLHWTCDFVWCYFLSALSFKGGQFFGRWFQRAVFLACGGLLLFFGVRLMVDGVRELIG